MPRHCPDCRAEMEDDGLHAWCGHCDFSGYVAVKTGKILRECSQPDCTGDAIAQIEGDWLCQHHANEWSRGEGIAAAEREIY